MAETDTLTLFIGCYTGGPGQDGPGHGVVVARFAPDTLAFETVGGEPVPDASYSVLAPSGGLLYAVREQAEGQVTAFAFGDDPAGLRQLGSRPSGGGEPCHLSTDPAGRYLLTANYGSGSVAVHPILPDGSLGELTDLVTHTGCGPETARQAGPHAHMVLPDPTGESVLAVDLGTDSVYAYTLDAEAGRLTLLARNRLRSGSGPRHLVFHPSGEFVYLANELDDTVSVLSYERGSGLLKELANYPAAASQGTTRNYPGGIVLSPDARHVYVSNRGDDSITAFAVVDGGTALQPAGRWACGGSWPRHLALTPDGRVLFCANQRSGAVAVFRVDPADGALSATGAAFAVDQSAHVAVVA